MSKCSTSGTAVAAAVHPPGWSPGLTNYMPSGQAVTVVGRTPSKQRDEGRGMRVDDAWPEAIHLVNPGLQPGDGGGVEKAVPEVLHNSDAIAAGCPNT